MPAIGPAALAIGLIAALLSATIWLSLLGAPVGVGGLVLGVLAIRAARKGGARSWTGIAGAVLSALAVLALPFFYWSCNAWMTCV